MNTRKIVWAAVLIWLCWIHVSAKSVHHYVFFGQDREKIKEASEFLETKALEGAQVTYSWRQLERQKDHR